QTGHSGFRHSFPGHLMTANTKYGPTQNHLGRTAHLRDWNTRFRAWHRRVRALPAVREPEADPFLSRRLPQSTKRDRESHICFYFGGGGKDRFRIKIWHYDAHL